MKILLFFLCTILITAPLARSEECNPDWGSGKAGNGPGGSVAALRRTTGAGSPTPPDSENSHPYQIYQVAPGDVFLLPDPALTPQARITAGSPFPAALVCAEGSCAVLVAVDVATAPGAYRERLVIADGNRQRATEVAVEIGKGEFPEQRITLPRRYVTPNRKLQARIARENKLVRQAFAHPGDWPVSGPFARPLAGKVTGAFGARRVLNGENRGSHMGVDLRAATGDPVRAAGNGRVVLAGDFYLSGQSVFIDHGGGVFSMYFHLSRIDVQKGDMVPSGAVVGRAGATGRSAGPHLHFGMRVKRAHVDPLGVIETLQQGMPGIVGEAAPQQVSRGGGAGI
jgi:murein DD-endopeptidase MepM/ murein hydrolase activator NlpD